MVVMTELCLQNRVRGQLLVEVLAERLEEVFRTGKGVVIASGFVAGASVSVSAEVDLDNLVRAVRGDGRAHR